jgi:hypothetical protein
VWSIAVLAIAGLVYFVNVSEQQTGIVHVFSEQSKAAITLYNELQQRPSLRQTQRDLREYGQAVQAIDASSCPKDFQLAWFDYASAVTDLSQKNLAASVIGSTSKGLLELVMSAWTHDGKLTEDAVQDRTRSLTT